MGDGPSCLSLGWLFGEPLRLRVHHEREDRSPPGSAPVVHHRPSVRRGAGVGCLRRSAYSTTAFSINWTVVIRSASATSAIQSRKPVVILTDTTVMPAPAGALASPFGAGLFFLAMLTSLRSLTIVGRWF